MIAERVAAVATSAAAIEVEERVQTPPPALKTPPAPEGTPPPSPPRREVRGPQPPRRRKGGWRSPMTAAVLVGTFLVSMLCIYVYAYARVTTAGFHLSLLRRDLQRAKQEEDVLRAEIGRLSLPNAVARRAKELGMELTTPEMAVVLPPEARNRVMTPPRGQ